ESLQRSCHVGGRLARQITWDAGHIGRDMLVRASPPSGTALCTRTARGVTAFGSGPCAARSRNLSRVFELSGCAFLAHPRRLPPAAYLRVGEPNHRDRL